MKVFDLKYILKIGTIMLIFVALIASGCTDSSTNQVEKQQVVEDGSKMNEESNETNASFDNPESSVKLETSESIQTPEPMGNPELRIMSTSMTDNVIHI